jgi:ATP-binding cassette subfamily B protein
MSIDGPRNTRLGEVPGNGRVRPGTIRRILPYARPYRWSLIVLIACTIADCAATAGSPLLLKAVIDDGILAHRGATVTRLALIVAGVALVDALVVYAQTWLSARVSEGLVYDLRIQVFAHVQRQPLAFFTRAQTGSLVSRLNTDVVGSQAAVVALLSQTTSTVLSVILIIGAMFLLSWKITLVTLVIVPLFLLPVRRLGRVLQRLTRAGMQTDAEIGSLMNERFNVGGAMLTKLYGRPDEEVEGFARRAARVRDITVTQNTIGRLTFIVATLLAALMTAGVYGFGGHMILNGDFNLGTLVAMVTLLTRLYGPINALSTLQINVMTALVSFDRVFEVLDLKPLITEAADARPLSAATAPEIEFAGVAFRYPTAKEVSLASLESIALPAPEHADDTWVLQDLSFRAPAGRLTALVGPSGAGKTTITQLVARLYDPDAGAVLIDGHNVRELTSQSLREVIGVVTQDTYLFHDTIRANLLYARPDATEQELVEACAAARIGEVLQALPDGLDTVVGDRGHRLSGGEKQRLALARMLLRNPPVVVLDEATAHLDSESEVAIQRALKTALADRTQLVIAHRLSTIRDADQILFVENGGVAEHGTHEELLAANGRYATFYRTQFAAAEGPTASATAVEQPEQAVAPYVDAAGPSSRG